MDENDLPDEELLRRWDEGEPVELAPRWDCNIPPITTASNAAWARTHHLPPEAGMTEKEGESNGTH